MPKYRKRPRAPPTAHCDHHDRMLTDAFIRQRGCLERRCKHLFWIGSKTDSRVQVFPHPP